jgi:hypothetical protein
MDLNTFLVGNTDRYTNASELELGTLVITSGRLRIRDPFIPDPNDQDGCLLQVPPGRYRTWVTLAEIDDMITKDRSTREAYLSIALADRTPTALDYADTLIPRPRPSFGALTGTDSATIAAFDDATVEVPQDALVDAIRADTPVPFGYANLPVGENNIITSHTGYGDGAFNVLLTHDSAGPIAIHIDFGILNTEEDDE